MDKKRIRDLRKEHGFIGGYIHVLLENPRRLLVTILLGNTIVNVAASIIAVIIALDAAKFLNISTEIALLAQIIILTVLILLFGELTPKLWASKHPLLFAKVVAIPLYWLSVLIYPVSKTLTDLLRLLMSKIGVNKSLTALQTAELTELADLSIEKGTIEENEHELIHGLVEFKSVTVREIMTPRVDITSVSAEETFDDLMQIITESGHSRIPLYENSLDNILGIIYAKDLLPYLRDASLRNNLSLRKICHEAMFVPETKLINELLTEFQSKNKHLGIVVDEYGGTAGLVSLEDILEEIVGEIRDEYDKEETSVTKIDDNTFVILGKVPIDELNELLENDFSSENDDYDTVGGFIFNHAGQIPSEGYSFESGSFRFTVKEIFKKRIKKVLVEKISLNQEAQ